MSMVVDVQIALYPNDPHRETGFFRVGDPLVIRRQNSTAWGKGDRDTRHFAIKQVDLEGSKYEWCWLTIQERLLAGQREPVLSYPFGVTFHDEHGEPDFASPAAHRFRAAALVKERLDANDLEAVATWRRPNQQVPRMMRNLLATECIETRY